MPWYYFRMEPFYSEVTYVRLCLKNQLLTWQHGMHWKNPPTWRPRRKKPRRPSLRVCCGRWSRPRGALSASTATRAPPLTAARCPGGRRRHSRRLSGITNHWVKNRPVLSYPHPLRSPTLNKSSLHIGGLSTPCFPVRRLHSISYWSHVLREPWGGLYQA